MAFCEFSLIPVHQRPERGFFYEIDHFVMAITSAGTKVRHTAQVAERGSEMKALVAAIALLCLSSTVLAHDIYSNLRDNAGHLCCNGQDCKPVEATVLPNGNYYLPTTDEIIPADMASPSPDDRFHHCTYYPVGNEFDRWGGPVWGDTPITRCFFAPMHSS